jgi:hypothetical protein
LKHTRLEDRRAAVVHLIGWFQEVRERVALSQLAQQTLLRRNGWRAKCQKRSTNFTKKTNTLTNNKQANILTT